MMPGTGRDHAFRRYVIEPLRRSVREDLVDRSGVEDQSEPDFDLLAGGRGDALDDDQRQGADVLRDAGYRDGATGIDPERCEIQVRFNVSVHPAAFFSEALRS